MPERMLELSNSEWAAECMVASSPVGPKGSSKGSTGPAVPAAASSSPVALPAAAPSVLGQAFAEWQINGFVAAGTTLSATAIHVVPPAILPIARWRFDDGMCFGANSKWWGDLGQRRSPNEGVDFCRFVTADGAMSYLAAGTHLLAMLGGVVLSVFPDAISHTVVLLHSRECVRREFRGSKRRRDEGNEGGEGGEGDEGGEGESEDKSEL
uniref:Uncharacterized protein n=1 Tax=Haptolina ericina TaxID=156174 RepID=A0A7S3F1M7_9EUKA